MIRQDHAAAFLALMATFPDGSPVYDGEVPKPTTGRVPLPYRLVYFQFITTQAEEDPAKVGLEDGPKPVELYAYVHSIAATARAARAVADQTYTVVADQELVVAGRVSYRIRHDDSQPPDRDTSTAETVFDAIDVYRLTTSPS